MLGSKNLGTGFEYGEYILTVEFSDGLEIIKSKILEQNTLNPVDENTINVSFNPEGGAHINWNLPVGGDQYYYQVRVRSDDGSTEYYASDTFYNINSLDISSYDLRCLEKSATYRWYVRVFNDVWGTGTNLYDTVANSYVSLVYDTALTGQRAMWSSVQSWDDGMMACFDVGPGSRDQINQSTLTGSGYI